MPCAVVREVKTRVLVALLHEKLKKDKVKGRSHYTAENLSSTEMELSAVLRLVNYSQVFF